MIVLGYEFFNDKNDAHRTGVFLRDRMLETFCALRQPHILRPPGGKPRLADPSLSRISFSVSHSGNLAVCALSFPGTADAASCIVLHGSAAAPEVGADTELLRPASSAARLKGIADRFCPPDEAEKIRALDGIDCVQAFTRLWTACESVGKMTGEGFGHGFRSLSFADLTLPCLTLRHSTGEYIIRAAWRTKETEESHAAL